MDGVPELIWQLLPRLREERGLSVAELSRITTRNAVADNASAEVPQKSIEALESQARVGQVPKARYIRALAKGLGVPPETFYEYPIAEAQEARRRDAVAAAEEAADDADRRA